MSIAPSPGILLSDYVQTYFASHDIAEATKSNYRRCQRSFEKWLGRPGTLADLTDANVNGLLVALQKRGLSPKTVRNERVNLLALWRSAALDQLIEAGPRNVRRIAVPVRAPESWNEHELAILLNVAAVMSGKIRRWHITFAEYFSAYVRCNYDSGLRLRDMHELRREQIGEDGMIVCTQAKTGWPITVRLRPETIEAIDRVAHPTRPAIFGGVLAKRAFHTGFQRLVKLAGLEGTTHKLRRTGASLLARSQPGVVRYHLGHRSDAMAARYYIDPKVAGADCPQPPAIEGVKMSPPTKRAAGRPAKREPSEIFGAPLAESLFRPLSPRQEEVLRFVAAYFDRHGCSPVRAEIRAATGIPYDVGGFINSLISKCYLARRFPGARNLAIAKLGRDYLAMYPAAGEGGASC